MLLAVWIKKNRGRPERNRKFETFPCDREFMEHDVALHLPVCQSVSGMISGLHSKGAAVNVPFSMHLLQNVSDGGYHQL